MQKARQKRLQGLVDGRTRRLSQYLKNQIAFAKWDNCEADKAMRERFKGI